MTARGIVGATVVVLVTACAPNGAGIETAVGSLSQPRGLSIDGSEVCVAEAGALGPDGTNRERPGQLEADTGRVICAPTDASDGGDPSISVAGLPFVYYPDAAVTSGAADVVHDDDQLYVLVGESYGEHARSVIAVGDDGSVRAVADLLAYAQQRSDVDGALRSNPYSFVLAPDRSGFFVSDAATGTVLRVGIDGVVDLFAPVPGEEVLTGLAWSPDGTLHVASFGQLPHAVGSGAVLALDAEGNHDVVVDGLTMVIDVGFDPDGGMFILEYATPPDDPQGIDAYRDGSGRLLHVAGPAFDSAPRVLLEGLDRPTAIAVGAGDLWIGLAGGELAPGEGSVVRLDLAQLLGRG